MIYINRKKHSHGLFYGLLCLLLMLCIVRYSLQIDIPQVVFLAVAVLIAILGDQDEIIAMCVCCIPLHTSFEYAYAVLLGMLVYVVKYGGKIRFNMTVLPIFLMILWEVIHCFGQSFSIVQFAGRCVPLLLIALLMCSGNTRFDYGFIVRAFAISIAAMCCSQIGKMLFLADFNLLVAFSNLQRLGTISEAAQSSLQVTGGEMNPNTLGIICVLGVTGLIQIRNVKQGKRWDILLMVLLLAFGMMTSSRTFLVCLVVMAVLLLFSQRKSLGQKIRFLLGVLFAVLLAVLLVYLFMPTLLEYYVSRFQVDDLTTGRMDLLSSYQEFIMSNLNVLFFGIGLHDFDVKVVDIYQVAINSPHNGIQELIIAWGIPGLVLFLAFFFVMIRRSRELCKRQGLINYVPLLVLLVKIQAGQMLNSAYTMLAFSYAYLSLCTDLASPVEALGENATGDEAGEPAGLEFRRALAALWRKGLIIATVSVVSTAAAFGITSSAVTPLYESTALFYVNNNSKSLGQIAESFTSGDIYVSRNMVETYIVILNARQTLDEVIEYAGVNRTYEELRGMITAAPVNDTEIFKVVVTSADRVEAANIANAIAACLPARIADIIEGTSAKVIDYAVIAARPSSPSKMTNAMLGFIFSFVLSVMIVLLQAMKDTTIRTEDDITDRYSYPVLAVIPDILKEQSARK